MCRRWPKRHPNKNYFLVPNEIFNLNLCFHEIAIYNYLLRCEDRGTYRCHPNYRTIGQAVQRSENTVRKYVASLEEKGLIRTEPSNIVTKDGHVRNGSLIYTICPIQEALELNYRRRWRRRSVIWNEHGSKSALKNWISRRRKKAHDRTVGKSHRRL